MLVIYDTSNFSDFPIGGQLTSIKNYLLSLAEKPEIEVDQIRLVGVSLDPSAVGCESYVQIGGRSIPFLPVACAESDQNHTKKSLRLEYLKGLFRYLKQLRCDEDAIHFIHTPEAFLAVRLLCAGKRYVFSHGSFFDMKNHVRFFKNSPIASIFQSYLKYVIKSADGIFAIDKETYEAYSSLNDNVHLTTNSITAREKIDRNPDVKNLRLLFVGRLSAIKNIGPIIAAAEELDSVSSLSIAGAGEEYSNLYSDSLKKTVFLGSQPHEEVLEQMKQCDILVMNSLHEGVPMTILEAMSVGLPVVSTDVGGIGETVSWGTSAEMTDGTKESIERAVERIADSYDDYSNAAYEQSAQYLYSVIGDRITKAIGYER
ncbi:glycosyltransferase family 4 protein [Paraeggerthella hongkongensis]|uniref:glycosyltransferase family 4 protein n=1 Tax=Paraeggerthella hominis TaxID=2897351 RepID=UPI001C110F1E|nr:MULTISPECIES: glycosyltransferase family 4 protein [Paraeggerthella]MBU5405331.1 glycosyltransferase family 4 protein [Paraeggerthella hongkongensis]MCD2433299.1 glycosyltransferase family 4 protein [Paraeggerthella hominis]